MTEKEKIEDLIGIIRRSSESNEKFFLFMLYEVPGGIRSEDIVKNINNFELRALPSLVTDHIKQKTDQIISEQTTQPLENR